MIKYFATLRFEEGGPAVTGEWADEATALRTYREWVGLYGSNPSVNITVTREAGDERRVLRAWTAQGEAQAPPDSAEPAP